MNRLSLLVLPVLLALAGVAPAQAGDRPTMGVEERIFCICPENCGKGLANCVCAWSDWYRVVIAQLQARGLSDAEIAERFIALYGEEMRASPEGAGAGEILARAVPISIFGVGLALVAFVGWRWRRAGRRAKADPAGPSAVPPATPEDDALVREALEREEDSR
ncbi:MAG: hypothetical protein HY720_17135 [Planctomycetes bacterium]|nr:hypothetical protein [Planctomycetota bacterium]